MPIQTTLAEIADEITRFTLDRQEILGTQRFRPDADERADRDHDDKTRILSIDLADGSQVRAWMDEDLTFGEEEEDGVAWLQPSDGSSPVRLWAPQETLDEIDW